eukprot:2419275-Pleurochrysis_carterae.AAC.1
MTCTARLISAGVSQQMKRDSMMAQVGTRERLRACAESDKADEVVQGSQKATGPVYRKTQRQPACSAAPLVCTQL